MRIRSKYLDEKLTAADPTSKWISDFVASDNPRFADKSKKERINMALGASYAAKGQSTNEETVRDPVMAFASKAHEEWRSGWRKQNDGNSVPRVKKNSDGSEGDINVPFNKLHPDWQKENLAAGNAAKDAVTKHPNDMEKAAEHVHNEWMKRNPKQDYNAAQHVSYSELPEAEKEKDRVHVRTMQNLMSTNEEIQDSGWNPAKERKDQYGNPIKPHNVPKRLARQGIPKQPVKDEKGFGPSPADKLSIRKEDVELDEARYPGFRPGLGLGKRGAPSQKDNYKDFNDGRPLGFTPIKDKNETEKKKPKNKEVEEDNKAYRAQDKASRKTTGMSLTQRTKMYDDIQKNLINQEKEYRKQGILPPKSTNEGIGKTIGRVAGQYAGSKLGMEGPGAAGGELLGHYIEHHAREFAKNLHAVIKKHLSDNPAPQNSSFEHDDELDFINELDEPTLTKFATRARFSNNPKHREAAKQAMEKVKKKKQQTNNEEVELDEAGKLQGGGKDPCWTGYKMVGTKKKGGREVPNCVPREGKEYKSFKALREELNGDSNRS